MRLWRTLAALGLIVPSMFAPRVLGQTLPTTTQPADADVPLPNGERMLPQTLCVASDGTMAMYSSSTSDLRPGGTGNCRLISLKTGKEIDLTTLVPKARCGQISPDSKKAWIVCEEDPLKQDVYLLDLNTLKATRVGQVLGTAALWVGGDVAVSSLSEQEGLQFIRIVKGVDGAVITTPIRCLPLAADPKGRTRVVAASATDMGAVKRIDEIEGLSLLALDSQLKKTAELGSLSAVRSDVRISPSGSYIAFQTLSQGPEEKYAVTILSTDGKESRRIERFALPLAVTDRGDILAVEASFAPGAPLWFCRKGDTKPTELAQSVRDACLVGDRVYYVQITVDKGPQARLKTMKLPTAR